MRAFVERSSQFLDRPLSLGPRALLVLATLLLVPVFLLPVWRMSVIGPDRFDVVRLGIYSYKISVATRLRPLEEDNDAGERRASQPDLEESSQVNWFPFAIGALGLLFLRAAALGRLGALVDLFVLYFYFALFSLWSFGLRALQAGRNVLPGGSLEISPFSFPILGTKRISDLEFRSHPAPGFYALAAVLALLAAALWTAWVQARRSEAAEAPIAG